MILSKICISEFYPAQHLSVSPKQVCMTMTPSMDTCCRLLLTLAVSQLAGALEVCRVKTKYMTLLY